MSFTISENNKFLLLDDLTIGDWYQKEGVEESLYFYHGKYFSENGKKRYIFTVFTKKHISSYVNFEFEINEGVKFFPLETVVIELDYKVKI